MNEIMVDESIVYVILCVLFAIMIYLVFKNMEFKKFGKELKSVLEERELMYTIQIKQLEKKIEEKAENE